VVITPWHDVSMEPHPPPLLPLLPLLLLPVQTLLPTPDQHSPSAKLQQPRPAQVAES